MVSIVAGTKGKGKTKYMLDRVNATIKFASGNIVYIDKNQKHMYELNNKIRLIDVSEFPISDCDEFIGFVCGIISQDHDIQEMFFDSFLTLGNVADEEIAHAIDKFTEISNKFGVNFVISISKDAEALPDNAKALLVSDL